MTDVALLASPVSDWRVVDALPGPANMYRRVLAVRRPGLAPGEALPQYGVRCLGVVLGGPALGRYRNSCGLPAELTVPAPWPQVLATALHGELLSDRRYPFPLLGMVHLRNTIVVHREIPVGATVELTAALVGAEPAGARTDVTIHTSAILNGELAWESLLTARCRNPRGAAAERAARAERKPDAPLVPEGAETWSVREETGRVYARASGDYNPIHLYTATARLFGFRRAIVQGMWTLARCSGALAQFRIPAPYSLEITFRRPIELPDEVRFCAARVGGGVAYEVRGTRDETLRVAGRLAPWSC